MQGLRCWLKAMWLALALAALAPASAGTLPANLRIPPGESSVSLSPVILYWHDEAAGAQQPRVVDDLVDSGNTAKVIRQLYPKAKLITIFAKPKGEALVDDFEVSIPQDTWIEQPWDMALSFVPPLCDETEE